MQAKILRRMAAGTPQDVSKRLYLLVCGGMRRSNSSRLIATNRLPKSRDNARIEEDVSPTSLVPAISWPAVLCPENGRTIEGRNESRPHNIADLRADP